MQASNKHLTVDLVVPGPGTAGVPMMAIDAMSLAARFLALKHGESYRPSVSWRLVDKTGATMGYERALLLPYSAEQSRTNNDAEVRRALFIPPLNTPSVPDLRSFVAALGELVSVVQALHEDGGIVCTVGSGAWLAASAGVLHGHTVAVPWNIQSWFTKEFRGVTAVDSDTPHRDRNVLSVSAASLHLQLLVSLLDQEGDPEMARIIERVLIYDPSRQTIIADADRLGLIERTKDSVLLKASQWIRANLEREITVDAISKAANVSRRTLFRHFEHELNCRPLDYVTKLRVKRAQVLLEITLKGADEIALACGYSSSRSLRRAFQRLTGESLATYRDKHSQRAKRARWRISEVEDSPAPDKPKS